MPIPVRWLAALVLAVCVVAVTLDLAMGPQAHDPRRPAAARASSLVPEAPAPSAPISAAAAKEAARAVNAFTADLLPKIAASGKGVFCSPYSIAVAMAVARAGAMGATAEQIDRALHLPPDAAASFRSLTTEIRGVRGAELSVANGLFVQRGWPLKPGYRSIVARDYDAEVRDVDYERDSTGAREAINQWVYDKTQERIKNIVPADGVNANTRLTVANAVFFKAKWARPFETRRTMESAFETSQIRRVMAKTMFLTHRFAYAETPEARAVELPYIGNETSMVVVLPSARHGLKALVAGLTPARLDALMPQRTRTRVALGLPKFTFTASLDVTKTLRDLGVHDAMGPNADFTGISDEQPLGISKVLHKAFVAVDEEGTEAAAATVLVMSRGGDGSDENTVPFTVDQPFLFFIRHVPTGVILFAGVVVDPTVTESSSS